MSDFLTVPVIANFDATTVIGELRILKSALPAHPDYCFALGFKALKLSEAGEVIEYELMTISPVSDAKYAPYVARHLQANNTASSSDE